MTVTHDTPGDDRTARRPDERGVLALAGLLAFGVVAWLHVLHTIALAEPETWAGHALHIARDGSLSFPLALLAVGMGRWLGQRSAGDDSRVRPLLAASVASLAFSLFLVPGLGAHEFLERVLDGARHSHLHPRPLRGLEGATGVVGVTLHGVRDALIGHMVGFPLLIVGLRLPRRRGHGSVGPTQQSLWSASWPSPTRRVVSSAAMLAVVGVACAGWTLREGDQAGHEGARAAGAHALIVSDVSASARHEASGLHMEMQSARWVSPPRETRPGVARVPAPSVPPDPDRLYVEVAVWNRTAQARTFGRDQFRLEARNGDRWSALADNFPAIVLPPNEDLVTMLIFEVPDPHGGLDLVWRSGPDEARIPIADASLGRRVPPIEQRTKQITLTNTKES
jgi:hypothetical protein